MLPDETLRSDVRLFTALNIRVLVTLGMLLAMGLACMAVQSLSAVLPRTRHT